MFFDGQSFRDLMGFLESFPDEAGYEDPADAENEIIRNIKYGRQMLEGMMIAWPSGVGFSDGLWQERAAFPGYPTADGSSGSFFYPVGDVLAMSSTCRNKDAAWEYIRNLIKPRRSKREPLDPFMDTPINLHDYELLCWGDVEQVNQVIRDYPSFLEVLYAQQHFTYAPKL